MFLIGGAGAVFFPIRSMCPTIVALAGHLKSIRCAFFSANVHFIELSSVCVCVCVFVFLCLSAFVVFVCAHLIERSSVCVCFACLFLCLFCLSVWTVSTVWTCVFDVKITCPASHCGTPLLLNIIFYQITLHITLITFIVIKYCY